MKSLEQKINGGAETTGRNVEALSSLEAAKDQSDSKALLEELAKLDSSTAPLKQDVMEVT